MTLEAKVYIKLNTQNRFPHRPALKVIVPDGVYTASDLRQKFPQIGLGSFFHEDIKLTVRKGSFSVHGGLLAGATMSSGKTDRYSGMGMHHDHVGRKPVVFKQADASNNFPNTIYRGTRMLRFRNI